LHCCIARVGELVRRQGIKLVSDLEQLHRTPPDQIERPTDHCCDRGMVGVASAYPDQTGNCTPTRRCVMHELAIAQSVVDAVAQRLPEARITCVALEVGKLSGIAPDALRFCFELVTSDTTLDGAALEITEPAGLARCEACHTEFALDRLILLCECGSADVHVVSGDQLLITSVKVA